MILVASRAAASTPTAVQSALLHSWFSCFGMLVRSLYLRVCVGVLLLPQVLHREVQPGRAGAAAHGDPRPPDGGAASQGKAGVGGALCGGVCDPTAVLRLFSFEGFLRISSQGEPNRELEGCLSMSMLPEVTRALPPNPNPNPNSNSNPRLSGSWSLRTSAWPWWSSSRTTASIR